MGIGEVGNKMFYSYIFVCIFELGNISLHVIFVSADKKEVETILCEYLCIASAYTLGETGDHNKTISISLFQFLF